MLELTAAEEDVFFQVFRERHGITGLSRDWDGYRIRNDEDIVREILARHLGVDTGWEDARDAYVERLARSGLPAPAIPGAALLLAELRRRGLALGIATANFLGAARHRLERAGLWNSVGALAAGADGGGHKRAILARAIARTGLAPERIAYLGDNLNDIDAGLANGVRLIGFSEDENRRGLLRRAGAPVVVGSHADSLQAIRAVLTSSA